MHAQERVCGRTGEARTPLWWRQALVLLNSALKPCLEYPYSCEFGGGDLSWPS